MTARRGGHIDPPTSLAVVALALACLDEAGQQMARRDPDRAAVAVRNYLDGIDVRTVRRVVAALAVIAMARPDAAGWLADLHDQHRRGGELDDLEALWRC